MSDVRINSLVKDEDGARRTGQGFEKGRNLGGHGRTRGLWEVDRGPEGKKMPEEGPEVRGPEGHGRKT